MSDDWPLLNTPDVNKQNHQRRKSRFLKSQLYWSVFTLVGLLTLDFLALHFVWLLQLNYSSKMSKELFLGGDGYILT